MSRLTDLFWPRLEKPTAAEANEDRKSERKDIEAARAQTWTPNEEFALEEARRLADAEEERRRSAEGKATTYLLFTSAFAAALIPFLPGILEGKTGAAPGWLIAIILIIAALYLVAAGIWAFRTLKVGSYHRLDVTELAHIWGQKDPRHGLIQETFVAARLNYQAVNDKVSCIKMAHEFMARSFVLFGILIVVEAGWEVASSVTQTKARHAEVEIERSPNSEQGIAQPAPNHLKPQTEEPAGQSAPSAP